MGEAVAVGVIATLVLIALLVAAQNRVHRERPERTTPAEGAWKIIKVPEEIEGAGYLGIYVACYKGGQVTAKSLVGHIPDVHDEGEEAREELYQKVMAAARSRRMSLQLDQNEN